MALQTNKPYTLLPFSARQDQPETPPIIHLRLRPQTVQLAQSASSLSIDINSAQGSAIILDGARHELLHSEEAASTDLYEISNREEDSLTRVGPIRDRFSERPADINAAGQRLKERREEEEAKRAEHRTVLLDAPASLKRSGLVHASSSAIPRSSSLSSLHRAARQSSETPSARGSPIIGGRAQSRPNLITAESIRAASPAPSSVNPNHSPSREHNHTAGTATAPPPPSASPYSSPRFSLRTRLVQFLALGPKPRRQIVAALSAPETQVLALLSKVADRPSELQPDLTAASSPAPQSAGSPQLGGSARFAGPVNRRITNAAPPARPQGHLSPSTVYILKDSVYLDEVNIDSWTAFSLQERRIVSKHAHEAFKRLGVNAENDPAGWSKLYPDGWPTEAQLRREREREELDRDPNFAMRDDEVLSEIDSDELEREFGNYANSSQHGQQQQQRRARRKRRRDYGSGSASGSPESSSELSDVPDTLPPLPISGRIIAKGRSPPPLSSSSSNSSLGASLGAKLKTLSTSVSMPSMSPTLTPTEKPPPKKKGLSTLERISRAAKGKGPSASERDKQIQKARKQVEGGLGLPTNNKTGKEKDPGSSQELSQGKMSVGSKTATSKRSGHSHQQSLPSMDFSMLHDIGRLRQEGSSSGAQEVRRTSSLTRLEQRGIGSSTASSSKLGNHSGGTAIAASVSPAASNSSTKLAQRERDRSSMGREKSQYTSAGSPPPSSKGGTKKLKKRPQRRDIEFTDSSDDEDGDGGEGGKTEGGSGSTSALSKKKSLKGSSAGVASQSSSKLGNVRARSSANSPLPRSHGSDSGSTVKDGSRTANRQSGSGSTTFVAKTKTNGMSGLSKAEREAYSLPGSMIRSHRGVGPGAHASAEPWLELRSVGDWHLLAERFLRVYGMYRTGRETIDRERERLVGEMEAAEREAQWKRQVEEREALRAAAAAGAAAAAAAAVAAESEKVDVKAKEDQHQHSEAQPRAGDRIREDSPEEGEMTPEQTHVALPPAIPPPPISMPVSASDTLGQMDSTSALGIDMAPPTAVSNGHMDDPSIPLSWRAHRAENDHVETTRGRLGPGFSVNTMMASSGLRGSALYGTGGLNHGSANSNPVLVGSRSPSTSRLGTSGPIPLAELEELVGKCKVWQGELYRMKRALVFFKRKIEAQEGRASESEAEAEVMEGEEGEGDRSRPAVVMGLGLETTASASAGVVDGDGDVRMG